MGVGELQSWCSFLVVLFNLRVKLCGCTLIRGAFIVRDFTSGFDFIILMSLLNFTWIFYVHFAHFSVVKPLGYCIKQITQSFQIVLNFKVCLFLLTYV